jgi:FdrA protein
VHVMGLLRRGAYADSIALMQIAEELRRLRGIATAALLMATPANLATLAEAELLPPEAEGAVAEDIVLAVRAGDVASGRAALARAEALLARPAVGAPAHAETPPRRG